MARGDVGRNWGDLMPPQGYRIQPRVLTLGTDHPKRRALMKGRQIEGPKKAEAG
jgi:hypothetical protein